LLGTDITPNFKGWKVGGNDYGRYPYGGWQNFVVDPETTADYTGGTLAGYRWAGIGINCIAAIGKGVPVGLDCIRYGRGQLAVINGDLANGYSTFAGMATANDASTARWGLFQEQGGSYLWKGLMSLGTATAVDFRDSNTVIFVDDTPKVLSTFNKIEVNHASSRVDWDSVSIQALGTVAKGAFECVANADINWESCTFTDMATFTFQSLSTVLSTTFRRCGQVAVGGGTFTGCTFDSSSATSAVLASSPANAALVTGASFVSGGTGHGLEITGTAANMTLTGNTWSGYAGADGSTGNEAVYVNIASGSMNLTISGGTTPSVRTAGAVVTVISGAVTATVKAVTELGAAITSAIVHLEATGAGPFPVAASVTIANAGTTATVTHAAHGMATNDKVVIRAASLDANNGVFTITKTGTDSYTYTMASSPGSSPTGSITSTFVVLNGNTDGAGEITMSRVFPSDQPVTGRIRKGSSAPYYKQAALTGAVSSSTGGFFTGVMISDD